MKRFKNFKIAHEYYNYPSTHRIGTIFNETGVIRSYSNNIVDKYSENFSIFYYKLKNNKIESAFRLSKSNNKTLRLFLKQKNDVIDLGLYKVINIENNYVKLKQI
jgi:hypothetical protein